MLSSEQKNLPISDIITLVQQGSVALIDLIDHIKSMPFRKQVLARLDLIEKRLTDLENKK